MAAVSCGIDWAQDRHDVAVVDEHGVVICAERIATTHGSPTVGRSRRSPAPPR
ncbi:MAG: IS110 family transposase [Pseudonocardia sp.]|nr:IS110 family transposase [Pseudonocardia sp.]